MTRMDLENVEEILRWFHEGLRNDYYRFVAKLRENNKLDVAADRHVPNSTLVVYLRGLSSSVTLLNRSCCDLVKELLKINWLNRDDSVLTEFHHFVCELVAAQTGNYLLDILDAIISCFRLQSSDPKAPYPSPEVRSCHAKVFCQLHQTLLSVLSIAPSARFLLGEVLQKRCPHERANRYIQECFIKNILKLSEYPAEFISQKLRHEILQLVFSQLIKIDVLISRDELVEAEDPEFDEAKKSMLTFQCAEKLDSLMAIMFNYIQQKCFPNKVFSLNAAKKLYVDLLSAFDVLLLRTQKSCHVQFLLFFICSFSKVLAENFLDFLFEKFENPRTESLYRQTAAMYVASFLARAKFVGLNSVKRYLYRMNDWIHRYMLYSCDLGIPPDAIHHSPFYTLCQALFYVFIYHHKDLLSTEKGRSFCKSLNFQQIVSSDLNPLKFCLNGIAIAFSTIVRNNYIAMCDTILERNRRAFIPTDSKATLIDLVFPFEPYLLKKSEAAISEIFQAYEHPDDSAIMEDHIAAEDSQYMEVDKEDESFALNLITNGSIETFINDTL